MMYWFTFGSDGKYYPAGHLFIEFAYALLLDCLPNAELDLWYSGTVWNACSSEFKRTLLGYRYSVDRKKLCWVQIIYLRAGQKSFGEARRQAIERRTVWSRAPSCWYVSPRVGKRKGNTLGHRISLTHHCAIKGLMKDTQRAIKCNCTPYLNF